jgi:hypothetical protein
VTAGGSADLVLTGGRHEDFLALYEQQARAADLGRDADATS